MNDNEWFSFGTLNERTTINNTPARSISLIKHVNDLKEIVKDLVNLQTTEFYT